MHLLDPRVNFVCSGIIAQGMGPALGAALSRTLQKKPGVAVSFIGEGAVNQGAFHETMNLAALWKLPLIVVVEDNAWGISVAKKDSTAVEKNHVRAAAYGIPGHFVPDNDPVAIYAVAGQAVARARAGAGPTLIEIETSRLAGHFMGDAEQYRPEGEKDGLFGRDPIPRMRDQMLAAGEFSQDELTALDARVAQQIEDAVAFARESAYPEPSDALQRVFHPSA